MQQPPPPPPHPSEPAAVAGNAANQPQQFTFPHSAHTSSQSASPPHLYSATALDGSARPASSDGALSHGGGGGGGPSSSSSPPSSLVKSILRKDVTPTHHHRGVSFVLPDAYLEDKERARIEAARDSAARQTKAREEAAQAQAQMAASASRQMSSPFVYPQEGLGMQSAAALMSRQQKTAFHPLTTPTSARGNLNPIQINPATAAANAAAAAAHATAGSSSGAIATSASSAHNLSLSASLLSPIGTTPASPSATSPSAAMQHPIPIASSSASGQPPLYSTRPWGDGSVAIRLPPQPLPLPFGPGAPMHPTSPTLAQGDSHSGAAAATAGSGVLSPNALYNPSSVSGGPLHHRSATPAAPFPERKLFEYPNVAHAPPGSGSQYMLQPFHSPAAAASGMPQLYSSNPTSPAVMHADTPTPTGARQASDMMSPPPRQSPILSQKSSYPARGNPSARQSPPAAMHPSSSSSPPHQMSNTVPRLSLSSMLTPSPPTIACCSPQSSDSTPSSSGSGGQYYGASAPSSAGANSGGSTLYARSGFPPSAQQSGAASSASSFANRSSPSPRAPPSLSSSLASSATSPNAPPSPSKQKRPLSFSWGARSAEQSCRNRPYAYVTSYLLPHVLRVLQTRRRTAILGALGVILLSLLFLLLAIALMPERTLTLLPPASSQRIRDVVKTWSLEARGGVIHDREADDDDDEGPVALEARIQAPQQVDRRSASKRSRAASGFFDIAAWIGVVPSSGEDDAASEGFADVLPLSFRALRSCAPTDLYCRLLDIPVHPISNGAGSGSGSGSGRLKRRVMLVVINEGFMEMALNLICSADMVGSGGERVQSTEAAKGAAAVDGGWTHGSIPRSSWLIACSDDVSFEFFMARGIAAVRMNDTSLLSSDEEIAKHQLRLKADTTSAAAAASASLNIGTHASGWGEPTHININREKVPLMLSIVELGVDVVLVDADVVFLHGASAAASASVYAESTVTEAAAGGDVALAELFDSREQWGTDLQVMYDHPWSLRPPAFGPSLSHCLSKPWEITSVECLHAWEMNGGFFLLAANERTTAMLRDMIRWLKARPNDHDQDALRTALKDRAAQGKLSWRLDDGSLYPPPATPDSMSYRFLSPMLAANGGIFFTLSRRDYLEQSKSRQPEPLAVHVNWVVGYKRKVGLMKQYSMWFVSGSGSGSSAGGASTLGAQCKSVLLRARQQQQRDALPSGSGDHVRPPRIRPMVVSTALDAARLDRPPFASASPAASLLFFTTPKPFASYHSLPASRRPDSDGLAGFDASDVEYTEDSLRAYRAEQQVQLSATVHAFRNWFSLTHTSGSSALGSTGVQAAIFSTDPAHATLARHMRMHLVSRYDADEYGLPFLHSLFQTAESIAHKQAIPALMYSNADLLYHPRELIDTTQAIQSYGFEAWMAAGVRSNVESKSVAEMESAKDEQERQAILQLLQETIVDANSSRDSTPPRVSLKASEQLFEALAALSRPYRTDALDFFLWSPGFLQWDVVPEFILGRIAFDNWMLHYANLRAKGSSSSGVGSIAVVDLTATVTAVHINHGSVALQRTVPRPAPVSSLDTTPDMQAAAQTAALSGGSEVQSHFGPNTMINVKLAGQSSLRGFGTVSHIGWRSVRLTASRGSASGGEIRVVKVRPDAGHIAELYDVALEAHALIHDRPSLILITIDTAHIPHLRNWAWHLRRALRHGGPPPAASATRVSQPHKNGILVFAASAEVVLAAKSLGLCVFELAPGQRNSDMLNGPISANLQILSLKSRATMLLLEFGYDILLSSPTTIWKRNPWRVMAERAVVQGRAPGAEGEGEGSAIDRARAQQRLHQKRAEWRSSSRAAAASIDSPEDASAYHPGGGSSFNPVSLSDGWAVGHGLDLVGFAYDSSPCNISSSTVLWRHTPQALKLFRRILAQHLALAARASMTNGVNYWNLQLDWYLQWELWRAATAVSSKSRGAIAWASVSLDAGVFTLPAAVARDAWIQPPSNTEPNPALPHLPPIPIRDHDLILANGWWFDKPGGLGGGSAMPSSVWPRESQQRLEAEGAWEARAQNAAGPGEEEDPCVVAPAGSSVTLQCGSLSAAEMEAILGVATVDRSVGLVPVPSDPKLAKNLNSFLARAREINFAAIVLIAESKATLAAALSPENAEFGFTALFGSRSNSPSQSSLVALRLHQLLARGFAVGLFDVSNCLLFGNPFEFVSNNAFERRARDEKTEAAAAAAATSGSTSGRMSQQAFFASAAGVWSSALPTASPAFLRPLTDLDCDVFAPSAQTVAAAASAHNNALLLTASSTAWTFLSVQPSEQSRVWIGKVAECAAGQSKLDPTALPLECMQSVSRALQSSGSLAICELDPFYFPSASVFFAAPDPSATSPPSPIAVEVNPGRGSTQWKHPSESGVWPLLIPAAAEHAQSGRISEWGPEWRARAAATMSSNSGGKAVPAPHPRRPDSSSLPPETPGQSPIFCGAPGATTGASFLFKLRVLTFSRARSLARLLQSLTKVDWMGDAVRLEVSVDRQEGTDVSDAQATEAAQKQEMAAAAASRAGMDDSVDSSGASVSSQRQHVLSVLHSFVSSGSWSSVGSLSVVLQPRHLGLVGQWITGVDARHDRDLTLVLEDDMELSPLSWSWIKGAICSYYLGDDGADTSAQQQDQHAQDRDLEHAPPQQPPQSPQQSLEFDPSLFGLSLQNQHYVLGQSHKNTQYTFLRFREEKAAMEAEARAKAAAAAAAADGGSPAVDAPQPPPVSVGSVDPSALFPLHSSGPDAPPAWRYQLLGTWGLLVWPTHWAPFATWARAHLASNAQLLSEHGGSLSHARDDPRWFSPCVPHLESSLWWVSKPTRVWSAWWIRYSFEQGWYGLYGHFGSGVALGVNHREGGENYATALGSRDRMLMTPPTLSAAQASQSSRSSNHRFLYPPLSSLPLFDFHGQRISVDPVVLRQRTSMVNAAQFRRGCTAKDYKQFE